MPMPGSSLAGSSGCAPGGTMHMSGCGACACLPLAERSKDESDARRMTKPRPEMCFMAPNIAGRLREKARKATNKSVAGREGMAQPIQVVPQPFVSAPKCELIPWNGRVLYLRRFEAFIVDAECPAHRGGARDTDGAGRGGEESMVFTRAGAPSSPPPPPPRAGRGGGGRALP